MKKTKITILFDAGPIVNGQKSGVGYYTYQLIEALAELAPDELELIGHYFNFLGRKKPQLLRKANIRYKSSKLIPGKVQSVLRRVGLQLPFDLFIRTRGDIALFPNFVTLPTIAPIKKAIVIHDLAFEDHPEYLQPANQKFLHRFVPLSIKKADLVLAVSENTKRELIRRYNCPETKLSVIAPAVDHSRFKPQSSEAIKPILLKFNIKKPYILWVGTIEPRKNLIGVLKAFEQLPKAVKQSHSLVLAGGKGWLDDEINKKYDELAAQYSLIKTGYIEEADLPALYAGAGLFVFPSVYEGFGIPPLEAMACGTPTITSNNTSLPEVVGTAAITVTADDTKNLSSQIAKVLSDKKLAESMRAKGITQAQKFTWEKSAQKLLKLIESL